MTLAFSLYFLLSSSFLGCLLLLHSTESRSSAQRLLPPIQPTRILQLTPAGIPVEEPSLEKEKTVAGLDKGTFGFLCYHYDFIRFAMWTESSHFSAGMFKGTAPTLPTQHWIKEMRGCGGGGMPFSLKKKWRSCWPQGQSCPVAPVMSLGSKSDNRQGH